MGVRRGAAPPLASPPAWPFAGPLAAYAMAAALGTVVCSCAGPRTAAPPALPPAPPPASAAPPAPAAAESDSMLGVWWPALGAPQLDSAGRLDWSPRPRWSRDAARAKRELRAGDSLAAWRAIAIDTAAALRPFALRRLAAAALANGDTAAADRWLGALARSSSPWSWEALRTRCDFAILRGAPARAESLLAAADRTDWSDLDRSAWLMRRATIASQRGDTARAAELAHQVLRRYPATSPAGSAASLLERLAAARGRSLSLEDLDQTAESARLRGDRADALRILERAHARSRGAAQAQVGLDLARTLREDRRFDAGLAIVAHDAKVARDAGLRAQLMLERARLLRDSGRGAEALKAYAALERASAPASVQGTAAWEHGIELVSDGRYAPARTALAHAAERGGERAMDARLLQGLCWLADGQPSRAAAVWEGAEGEAFEFWRAVLARRAPSDTTARQRADRSLAAIAARPGYGFYRVAARDTLGVRGWPSGVSMGEPCEPGVSAFDLAEALFVLGESDGATLVLQRWSAAKPDPEAGDSANCETAAWIEAAELAAAFGKLPVAIRLAQKALDASPRADSKAKWGLLARIFPPALETLYASIPESAGTGPIDRSLLRAVAWQESRFDPRARSRSDALGLYQLKLGTAGDMARRLGEPKPTREGLFDPATSVRYGREYLRWLLERFDGQWIVALSAYNSGPSSVSDRWRTLVDRGGAMLFCELIGRAETRDYVRKILGARQAYREIRPFVALR